MTAAAALTADAAALALEEAVAAAADGLSACTGQDWDVPAQDLTWTVSDTVAHIANCLVAYAGQSLAEPETGWVVPDIPLEDGMTTADAVRWLRVAGQLQATTVRTASPASRGYHPYGTSDPVGFACMGIVEALVHTYDVTTTFGVPWRMPDGPARTARERLFRDVPAEVAAADPVDALLWCCGRQPLGSLPRRERWRWDGTVADADVPEPAATVRGTGWWGSVLESPDPQALAGFYARLLGWRVAHTSPQWCTVAVPGTTAYLGFHVSEQYRRPVWPPADGQQQAMAHLDVEVHDLAAAVERAVAAGATLSDHQPQDDVRVMLDPDGHPFCLYEGG